MKENNAFITYVTYETDEHNECRIHLFGRLEDNRSFEAEFDFKPYFFVKADQEKEAKKLIKKLAAPIEIEQTELTNLYDEKVIKLTTDVPKRVSKLRQEFEKNNIPCYEADIKFTYRFMIDNNIKASCTLSGKESKKQSVDVHFINPEIKPIDYYPRNLKLLSIDIETSKSMKYLYSISLYSDTYQNVLINSKQKDLKNAETFSSEASLLTRFKEIIKEQDPDIITGWYVIGFDFAKLKEFFKKAKIGFNLGRIDEPCAVRVAESYFKDSSADFKGRIILDGLALAKRSFIKLDDYKLNTAAKTILGDEKLLTSDNRGEEIEELFLHNQQKLVDYNLKDSKLVYDIIQKSGMLELTIQRSKLTGMMLDKVQATIATFDSVYLPRLRKKGKVAFNTSFSENRHGVRGGFVLPSKPGIYDWVIVCDFKSLYPTVFRTFNIDPYSYFYDKKKIPKKLDKTKFVIAPNNAVFRNNKGIMPELLKDFFRIRAQVKKEKNAMASFAIKTVMASFSGVIMSPNCRFSTFELGDSITSFAQMILKQTMKMIEDKGYNVIYGDTDSIFIDLNVKSFEQAKKAGKEIETYINTHFDKWVPENYARKSYLELEFEKTYSRFLIPYNRGSDVGAKKRYAGLIIKDNKEEMEFTGLEFVRRDWTEVSKIFQLTLLDKIFHKKEVVKFVRIFVEDLKKGKYDEKLIYKKALRKDIKDYTKITPPHVKAAKKQTEITSNIIEYVMTTDGPEPLTNKKHQIDYAHYINKQIKPIADSVLVFFDQKFDDIIEGVKQKSLFGF